MKLIVSLGLSEFADRDSAQEACKDSLRQAMRLLHDFAPRAQWILEYCEDCVIEVDISDEALEKFKADEHTSPEDEDWLYRRCLGDGFWVTATATGNASPWGDRKIPVNDKTMKGVLTAVAKTGWLGEIPRIIAL